MLLSRLAPGLLLLLALSCSSSDDPNPSTLIIGPGDGGEGGSAGSQGGSGKGGSAQAGKGGSAQAGSGGSPQAGSSQAGSSQAGSAQAGSGGSSQAGQGGSAQAGSGGEGQAGSSQEGGAGGEGQAGDGQAGDGGAGGSEQAGQGGSEAAGSAGDGGSGGSGTAGSGSGDECPPVAFPSGVSLQTKKDPALTALYEALGVQSCSLPACFIDASDLRSADGTPQPASVKLAANFTFYELVGTDIDPKGTGDYDAANAYSARVLVSPELVAKLQKLREIYGGPVVLTSGFRSPQHQKQLCQSICGADQCTDGSGAVTCAKNSRHMWGAAADMDLKYEAAANQAGFAFVFHENGGTGAHLHVDMQSCK